MKSVPVFVSLLSVFAFAAPVLTVDDLVRMAIEKSPDLNISRADFNASVRRSDIASGDYLPRIDLSAAVGETGVKAEVTGENKTLSSTLMTGKVSASQLVYDFGKTGGNIRAYAYDANASRAALKQKISDKILEVKRAFYNTLKAKTLIDVNRENVKLNEQQLRRSERYFQAGIRTRIDVSDARVNLISARLALQNAHYEYRRARIRLAGAVGTEPFGGEYTLLTPELNTSTVLDTLPDVDETLDTLSDFAYRHREEIRMYRQQVKSADERVTSARGDYFPGIRLNGDFTHNEVNEDLQLFVPKQQWNALVSVKWNLFEGMKTRAKIEERRAGVLKSRAELSDAKLRIRQEVADAQVSVLKNRDALQLSKSLTEAAKEKFVQAQKRYEHGLSDYIELQQARQGYIDASAALVTSYYDFFIALATLDRAVGR